ncbi:hypothetical protein D9615_003553 [Tricholomella constricta]|uniref:Uncharacterized protein n=1 Tax=Tricholomella constricta TaxID=117010 RepID=A0A8H5HHZ0_9AGAR|nr:hypothetical protein D9615_003553 [Tricholomella constricta]
MLPGHSYWLSYNSCGAKNRALSGNANAFLISIVLDHDARHHFSAIRLVIVCRESIYLDHLRIFDCLEAYKYDGDNDTTYRAVLEQHRLNSHAALTLPACVITLEVVLDGDSFFARLGLAPLPQHEISDGQLRIAYDRTLPSTPSHPFFRTFLHSTRMLGNGYDDSFSIVARSPCIVAYSIRLLPASRSRSETVQLSSEIIRRIIEYAIEAGPLYQLLAYGLVCKAWTHVIDLFFERYNLHHLQVDDPDVQYPDEWQPHPIVVARCLQRRPDRAVLIRRLNMHAPHNAEPIIAATWKAVLTILTLAKFVREMTTSHIPPYVTKLILTCFREMRDVRSWTLGGYYRDHLPGRNHVTMDQIQSAIAGWEHLHSLRLTEWRKQDSSKLHSPAQVSGSTPIRLSCKIKSLRLSLGALSGPQLLRFAPPPTSYFQHITLDQITGPSNHDLFLLLSHAAPTLVSFSSTFCDFPTSSDHEERALDAAMPEMCALEDVSVHGNIATHLSIARKLPGRRTLKQPTTIMIEYTDISEHSVAQALEMTAWERVVVVWDPEGDDIERDERLISIASKKGVEFRSEEVLYRYGTPV